MKQFYKDTIVMAAAAAMTSVWGAAYAEPATPSGLEAGVTGTRVELSWSNGDAGETLLDCGFEEEAFAPEGWSARVTNDYAYLCSWFHYPSDDFLQTGNYTDYIHTGEGSAMLYFDIYAMNGDHDAAQDEWLITPSLENASYLELYYYIDPTILEYGADEAFPDHYYIKVSHDGGETWETIWDARYDAASTLGWHSLALPLGSGPSAMVAFQGVSDTAEMVHFLWALDDVRISSSRSGAEKVDGYTIRLDGNVIAEHVTSLEYTDRSPKTPGTHVYEVFAESDGRLSTAATREVTIEEIKLLPPTGVSVEAAPDENDESSYIISLSWEAPQGVIAPAYYNVYCDGMEVGTMIEDTSLEYWGYTKGIYDFRVAAVYEDPDGESERVGRRIAIDTRYNARNLQASVQGANVALTWETPEEESHQVAGYEIWRADTMLADAAQDLAFTDSGMAEGIYRYYVTAVYTDGVKALPAYVDVEYGEPAPRALPLSENFDSGHLPADWTLENLWENTPESYLWQFGDPNGIGVAGDGFDKGFASIDCINSGFYSLDGALVSPAIDIADCDSDELAVTFSYDYASTGFDSEATLEIETDGSGEWTPVVSLGSYDPEATEGFAPETATFPLGDYAGQSATIRLRWHYCGMMDYHLAIDNVTVTDAGNGIETVRDGGISVVRDGGVIKVSSPYGLGAVSVYNAQGRIIMAIDAQGAGSTTLPVDGEGILIVKASSPSGSRTVKVM